MQHDKTDFLSGGRRSFPYLFITSKIYPATAPKAEETGLIQLIMVGSYLLQA